MIAVDASALVSVVLGEPEREAFLDVLFTEAVVLASVMSIVETRCVLHGRRGALATADFDTLLQRLGIQVVQVDTNDLPIIHDAFLRYGKGSGSRARLNMGDLFSYALAKRRGIPLLFKGDDFTHTDLMPALPSP